ncbi:MAG: glycosyltransferase family 4 protein [Desulfotignum sp.]|nr:glycosyltransferase family 4 protein [Desulfotignum sp.]
MKILFVTTISDTVNAFLIPHIQMLITDGHQVDLAFDIHSEIDPRIHDLGCKIHPVSFKRSIKNKKNLTAFKNIRGLIKKKRYHLIHTHTPIASVLTRLAYITVPGLDTSIVYTAHGFHFFNQAPLINWLLYYPVEKFLSRFTNVLITINNEDYHRACRKFKTGHIRRVNGVGVNLDKFRPCSQKDKMRLRKKYGYGEHDFVLFFAAEFNQTKNQELLIHAVIALKNKIPGIRLLLAGTGDLLKTCRKQVKKMHIQEHVHLLGYQKNIQDLLAISDAAVSSSRREGLPVNIMEAMATGLPIIATGCRGNRDLVTHGHNGTIVAIDNVQQMAEAVFHLYSHKELQTTYGRNSLNTIDKYSLHCVLAEMKKIYDLVIPAADHRQGNFCSKKTIKTKPGRH